MTWLIVVIAIAVVLAAAVAYKWIRSAALRQRFGPEYERILALEGGDQRRADAALRDRTRRRAALNVRDLEPDDHTRYRERWFAVQGHFVDNPRSAVSEAAGLVRAVMKTRGYQPDPVLDDPDTPVYDELDLVAVDHPEAATRFRTAQDTARNGSASTEELRQAFQGYKALFEAVLVRREDDVDAAAEVGGAGDAGDLDSSESTESTEDSGDTGTSGEITSSSGVRHRVLDLRRRSHDADAPATASATSGDGSAGGFFGRFRRQPADHESR